MHSPRSRSTARPEFGHPPQLRRALPPPHLIVLPRCEPSAGDPSGRAGGKWWWCIPRARVSLGTPHCHVPRVRSPPELQHGTSVRPPLPLLLCMLRAVSVGAESRVIDYAGGGLCGCAREQGCHEHAADGRCTPAHSPELGHVAGQSPSRCPCIVLLGACPLCTYTSYMWRSMRARTKHAGRSASVQSEAAPRQCGRPSPAAVAAIQVPTARGTALLALARWWCQTVGSGRPDAAGCRRVWECVMGVWEALAALCARPGGSRRASRRESDEGGHLCSADCWCDAAGGDVVAITICWLERCSVHGHMSCQVGARFGCGQVGLNHLVGGLR